MVIWIRVFSDIFEKIFCIEYRYSISSLAYHKCQYSLYTCSNTIKYYQEDCKTEKNNYRWNNRHILASKNSVSEQN